MAGNLLAWGSSALVFGPVVVDYGPKGITTHYTVTCSQIGPLISYYNSIITYGASGQFHGLDFGADGYTSAETKMLSVSLPGLLSGYGSIISELFFDQWELLANETTDSIFSNPLISGSSVPYGYYSYGAGWLSAADKAILSVVALTGQPLAAAATQATADLGSTLTFSNDAKSVQLYKEIRKGQTEFQRPIPVLRHTSYCSAGDTYNANIVNDMCIYSKSQLLSEIGSGWTYPVPPRISSKISSIPQQYAPSDEASYYSWGWLKKVTRENVMANFMVEISSEYELGLWSNLRYATAS